MEFPVIGSLPTWSSKCSCLYAFLILLVGATARADEPATDLQEVGRLPPVEAADVQKTFVVQHGFRLDLVAHEPVVNDPVDGCFDGAGNLFIAEMRGYPYSAEPRPPQQPLPIGRQDVCLVRRLVDADRDGIFESSTVFADGLSWVVSVCCFDDGVFVLAPHHLYYFKDTTGDGVADVKQVVASGFGRGNVQALANNLKWGPDGLIYFAAGIVGGDITIYSPEGVELQKLTIRGRDLRFDPWTRKFELITGGQQFGHSFDDWGQRFICNNSNHIMQVIWTADALDRLAVSPPNAVESIAVEGAAAQVFRKSPAEPWRIVRTRRRASDPEFVKRSSQTELVPTGFFTSATGVTTYRGDAYPEEFHGNVFIGDVGGNLIHRKTLTQTGVVASAKRADENVEFVTSTDTWFRPTNFINGPDGCLYITDMYRETIEHPFSIPEDIKSKLDLESGTDRGRIYRLTPAGGARTDWRRPAECSTVELVELLTSTNGWHRETAQRLLLERRDPTAIDPLKRLARKTANPLGQMLAVRTLAALGNANVCDVISLLTSQEPQARRVAVQLGIAMLVEHPNYSSLRNRLFDCATDPSAIVRFEVAIGLARVQGRGVSECWAQLASSTDLDGHMRAALLGSATNRPTLARAMLESVHDTIPPLLVELLRLSGAKGDEAEIASILTDCLSSSRMISQPQRWQLLVALGQGLRTRGMSLLQAAEATPMTKAEFTATCEAAANQLKESNGATGAVTLLAFAAPEFAVPVLVDQIKPQVPVDRQREAIAALGDLPGSEGAFAVLAKWKELGPEPRRDAIEILLRERTRVDALLAAITDQQIKSSEISAEQWQQLLGHPELTVRERATSIRGQVSADREQVIAAYRETVEAGGDFERGRAVYKKICSVCHKVGSEGHVVGPDLVSVANKSPADLLVAILDPNREAQPKFVSYILETTQGQVFTGILASESASSVTLRRSEAKEDTIARELIETMTSTGISLMPVGVEKDLTPQDIADVITFVRGQGAVKPQ